MSENIELMTVREVAGALRCSPDRVRRLVRLAEMPAVRVGPRAWRIPTAHVRALLAAAGVSLTFNTAGAHA